MMFVRQCGEVSSHAAHAYTKTWNKSDTVIQEVMPPHYREDLPLEWDSQYKCNGNNSWTVTTLHEDCVSCEDCTEAAILHARMTGSRGSTFATEEPVQHAPGVLVLHSSKVVRA